MNLLLPHVSHILELIQRCLADSERTDAIHKAGVGLIGDLADTFPEGQIKQLLLSEWISTELRTKQRASPEVRKTIRWAREVSCAPQLPVPPRLTKTQIGGQARHSVDSRRPQPLISFPLYDLTLFLAFRLSERRAFPSLYCFRYSNFTVIDSHSEGGTISHM